MTELQSNVVTVECALCQAPDMSTGTDGMNWRGHYICSACMRKASSDVEFARRYVARLADLLPKPAAEPGAQVDDELRRLVDEVGAFETLGGASLGTYDKMAEAFIVQIETIKKRSGCGENISHYDRCILNGISEHMRELAGSLNWFNPDTIRHFYADIRRWADRQQRKRQAAAQGRAEKNQELDSRDDYDSEIPF